MPRKAGPKPSFIIELDDKGNVVAKHKLNKQGCLVKVVNPKGITVRTKNGIVPARNLPEISFVKGENADVTKLERIDTEIDIFSNVINDIFHIIDVQNCDVFHRNPDLTDNIRMLFDLI
ncbi:hypothetical protein TVAG_232440 [Trichomonas vaginalis G3]|uniref:Uncharacterized protein n=1 Tax=Trichomonas vaginalis (strain ATCC PRA-98 / G3) TaxID=412133 RepID=A2FXB0_TRIV3|nr:hypothetical protein TVAGG3_0527230 [Trichomonas vaginalis G3]EAX90462.1 hypothetical protein TVAG_232440 [Trichomonas vaginalis G3]KAI5518862.1 hypothetical protein TVAGG3_0527230 [Trichomonas vaginalis G3]|eukprot:XP_001303392.1 hypothetical protein [Trichomonas vaginalis G3]